MRFSTALFISALAAMAAAQNQFTMATLPASISAGSPFNITWQPTTSGTISLVLVQADSPGSKNVHPVSTIAGHIANSGAFVWTPDNTIPKGSGYALEIVADDSPASVNYSGQFAIDSTTTASPSSASGSVTSSISAPPSVTAASTTLVISSTVGSSSGSSPSATAASQNATVAVTKTTGSSVSTASVTASTMNAGAAETARAGMGLVALLGVAMLAL